MIGSLFIVGFKGPKLSDETRRWVSENQIGGFILFNRNGNIESPEQVHALAQDLQSLCEFPIFIGVDQEGGRVQRLRHPLTEIPSAQFLAEHASPSEIFDISAGMARELRSVGINLNFAPVADIRVRSDEAALQDRAFGSDVSIVSKCVTAFVRGHLKEGVLPCVKHFPGHGAAILDSHLGLPSVDTSLELLRAREWQPFAKAIRTNCPMVMTAHIQNSNLDPDNPATFSERTLHTFLREELRYQRLIATDDLEMGGALERLSAEEIPLAALNAGCDLLLYRSEEAARIALESVQTALQRNQISHERIQESIQRIEIERAKLNPISNALPNLPDQELHNCIEKVKTRGSTPSSSNPTGSRWVEQS